MRYSPASVKNMRIRRLTYVFIFMISALSAQTVPGNTPDKARELINSKPSGPAKTGNPPGQTPSGTKPAEPANPGQNPATPAEPGKKEKSGPSGGSAPQGVAAAAGAGVTGVILGDKNDKDDKKEDKPVIAEPAVSTAPAEARIVAVSSAAAEPLYSAGKGARIAIIDFEGEYGTEFAELLAEALRADLKVYNRTELAAKKYETKAVTRISAKKIAAETAVDYLVTGKVNKKTETLSIISIFLRDGKTGDIKMTDYPGLRSPEDLKSAAETASEKIKERTK